MAASRPPRWWPIGSQSMPWRAHSSSVCAKSRAVTSTSTPCRSSARMTGRRTSTCGELVRSTQTRIAHRGHDLGRLLARQHRAHRDREVGTGDLVGAGQRRPPAAYVAHRRLLVDRARGSRPSGRSRRALSAAASVVGALVADDVEVPGGLGCPASARAGRRARRGPRPRSGRPAVRRPSAQRVEVRAAARAGSPPAARRAASCSRRARRSACRASRGSAASARARRPSSSLVVIAPPSPNAPRFFDGKNENVATRAERAGAAGRRRASRRPARRPRRTGTPSASISATGATLPNRCTTTTAFVRGVSAARTVSGVTQNVSGSTSQKTGARARRRDRLGRRVERERRDDDLVAGPDAERAQRDRQRVGAVGDADRVARRRR